MSYPISVASIDSDNNLMEPLLYDEPEQSQYFYENGSPSPYCPICCCIVNYQSLYTLHCAHTFCRDCIRGYLQYKVSRNEVLQIRCPNHKCGFEFFQDEVESLLDEENRQRYLRFLEKANQIRDIHLRPCPQPDCEGYDHGSLQNQKLTCNKCEFEYCYYCQGQWHQGKPCPESLDRDLDKWAKTNNIRFCPKCHCRVQKVNGCNHMSCPLCQYQWCWLCGSPNWSDANHFLTCQGNRQYLIDPPLILLAALFFSPILIIFYAPISLIFGYEMIREEEPEAFVRWPLFKSRWSAYPMIFAAGLAITPFLPIIGVITIMVMFVNIWPASSKIGKALWLILSPPLGFALGVFAAGIGMGLLGVLVSLAHISSYFYCIYKLVLLVRRSCSSQYRKKRSYINPW